MTMTTMTMTMTTMTMTMTMTTMTMTMTTTRPAAPDRAASAHAVSGVLVVDKPKGPTSHDVVDRVRRALGVRRVGHTGTLDPFATGVLPVCVGKATRLVRFLSGGTKVYVATVRLGFDTDTDDLTGTPLHEPREVWLSTEEISTALSSLVGEIEQTAPAYSAKHVAGRRLYDLAREGVAVTRPTSRVVVHEIRLLQSRGEELDLEVSCSPGTYIRALARDLGAALRTGGHLTALRRLRSGSFGIEQAVTLDALGPDTPLVFLKELLPELPAAVVGAEGRAAIRNGRPLPRELVLEGFPETAPERLRLLDESGDLLALAVPRGFASHPAPLQSVPTLHPDIVLMD
jgi:tRNA pseudouridine55 synthase